jgi:asparagine synthase (glutamine-hydrolysing)
MSVQLGRWNLDSKPLDLEYFERIKPLLVPYGPDGTRFYSEANVGILYCAFHATEESRRETQPQIASSGVVITWQGRLDNRTELIHALHEPLTTRSTDLAVVVAAYERWGNDCFAKLIGDWVLSVWNPRTCSLILANDPTGTRHLYYSCGSNQVSWSSLLDPLILFAGKTFPLCEEYIAGWLSFSPAVHLTPYIGIHAVPPSCFVLIRPREHALRRYWNFDGSQRIRHRTDREYEEHFRIVFSEAIRRRLRSAGPVLAELSGGIDSSSIVCTADNIIARGAAEIPRLDTVSYFDDSEPNWNERPYFTKVEEKRGRSGCHIDVSAQSFLDFAFTSHRFAAIPVSRTPEADRPFAACMLSQGNRVLLSGVGGDEITGGVPTAIPELEDLLATCQFRRLAHQLKAWALTKRKPWFHLLFEAAGGFFPPVLVKTPRHLRPAPWLNPDFVQRNQPALHGYESRLKIFGPLPTLQENICTLMGLQRQLACHVPPFAPPYEKRYPYLDRSLLEFIYAVPREQLVRPGHRRSLMRRALVGIVPDEILNRKRKAQVVRRPLLNIGSHWTELTALTERMLACELGIVDSARFKDALGRARDGQEVALVPLLRTLVVEYWLKNLEACRILPQAKPGMPLRLEFRTEGQQSP